eukprot:9422544-Pyramimonas_sp.AAC.1
MPSPATLQCPRSPAPHTQEESALCEVLLPPHRPDWNLVHAVRARKYVYLCAETELDAVAVFETACLATRSHMHPCILQLWPIILQLLL